MGPRFPSSHGGRVYRKLEFFDGHAKWARYEATRSPRNLWSIDGTDR